MRTCEEFTDLLGLSETDAKSTLSEKGMRLRILARDGIPQLSTCEVRSNRVNVLVRNGRIIEIDSIG